MPTDFQLHYEALKTDVHRFSATVIDRMSIRRVALSCLGRLRKKILGLTILTLGILATFALVYQGEAKTRSDVWPRITETAVGRPGPLALCEGCTQRDEKPRQEVEKEETSSSVMERRKRDIVEGCARLPRDKIYESMPFAMRSLRHKLFFCPVAKIASTFWRQFFYQLILTDPMRPPFEVSIQTVYSRKFPESETRVTEKGDELKTMLSTFNSAVFVRDPYSRLLSAYVDKLLAPNPILWKMWGRPAIDMCSGPLKQRWCKDRASNAARGLPNHCAQDATFPEFIKLATKVLVSSNNHIMPIYRLCSPCIVNYTVVGHMETFNDDVRMLLPYVNVTSDQIQLDQMSYKATLEAIEDSVHDAMSKTWLKQSLQCISKLEVVKRIWRKLQIRGFVSWRVTPHEFGLNATSAEKLDGPELEKMLVEANRRSTSKDELKLQKKQAMREAFSSLQPEQFTEIAEKFGPDFDIFGFEQMPKAFQDFGTAGFIDTGAFDLNQEWNLEPILR